MLTNPLFALHLFYSSLLLAIWYLIVKYAASQDIFCFNGHQIDLRDVASLGQETIGTTQACPIEGVAYAASIGEAWHEHPSLEIGFKCLKGLRAETIHLLREHELRDGQQFLKRIVGKIEVMRNA